jgi:hypothetical protein
MMKKVLFSALFLLMAGTLFAQQDQGFFTGTVADETGAVIPGAEVEAREVNTNIVTSALTNETGTYVLGPVRIGTYEVSVELTGFKRAVASNLEVHPSDRIGLDFTLELGAISDTVTVTSQTPLLKTETSSLDHVVDRQAMEQLPLLDRNYQVLAKLTAGVLPEIGGRDRGPLQRGGTLASGFTSHGQPSLQNNYLIPMPSLAGGSSPALFPPRPECTSHRHWPTQTSTWVPEAWESGDLTKWATRL